MKPLKEIGTLIKPEFESMTQFEPFIQLSLQERRELVREAIRKFEAFKWGSLNEAKAKSYGTDLIEEFIKEQGL